MIRKLYSDFERLEVFVHTMASSLKKFQLIFEKYLHVPSDKVAKIFMEITCLKSCLRDQQDRGIYSHAVYLYMITEFPVFEEILRDIVEPASMSILL